MKTDHKKHTRKHILGTKAGTFARRSAVHCWVVLLPLVVCFCHGWFCLFVCKVLAKSCFAFREGHLLTFPIAKRFKHNSITKTTHVSNVSVCISQFGCKTDLPLSVRTEAALKRCSVASFRFT